MDENKEKKPVKIGEETISRICMSLSLMLHSGVSAADGLTLMAEDEPEEAVRGLLKDMALESDYGTPLSEVFRKSECFPDYTASMLQVGETSGRTEESLLALSDYYDGRVALAKRLRSALLYPAILLVIMLAVIVVLLVYVLPIFNDVYAQLGSSLTGVAGGLLALGETLGKLMPVLCVVLGLIVLCVALFALSDKLRAKLLAFWRRRFGDRGISGALNTARFASALSMGLHSGLDVEQAIEVSAKILKEVPAAEARCNECLNMLQDGKSLAAAMGESGLLPKADCRLLDVGMRSGAGDLAIERIATRLSDESNEAIENRVGRIEPALVIITSVLVGLILLSVMMPLMNIMTMIG